MNTKRFLVIASGALLLIGVLLLLTPSGTSSTRRYRAESMVIANPYTNAFFSRSFESHVIRTIPTVLSLRVTPAVTRIRGSGATNSVASVAISIVAAGPTSEAAQRAANEAATSICRMMLTSYGVTGQVAFDANSARNYSYFHDSFQPAIGRLFKH
jgi:hypothetical protein